MLVHSLDISLQIIIVYLSDDLDVLM